MSSAVNVVSNSITISSIQGDDSLPELNIQEVDEIGFGGLAIAQCSQSGWNCQTGCVPYQHEGFADSGAR